MPAIVAVENLRKVYASGFEALKGVSLDIEEGEILALLGPNGAGKTTLISTICGIIRPDLGPDHRRRPRRRHRLPRQPRSSSASCRRRSASSPSRTVINTVRFTRGLFGKPPRRRLSRARPPPALALGQARLADQRALRRHAPARADRQGALARAPRPLPRRAHRRRRRRAPQVDVGDRSSELRAAGTTIILTTHYIEEAEAIADRIAVINGGRILLVEDKATLMRRMGRKQLTIELQEPIAAIPAGARPLPAHPRRRRPQPHLLLRPRGQAHRHRLAPARPLRGRAHAARPADPAEVARGHLRRPGEGRGMNWRAVRAIYRYEMSRTFRTLLQSLVAPVISTSLYFVVFGTAIGSRIERSRASPTAPSSCPA